MHEFNSRIAAQRRILEVVNRQRVGREELFSLSSKAIERWVSVNRIDPDTHLVELLRVASSKLFFLANRSQEQVTADYRAVAGEVAALLECIEREIG